MTPAETAELLALAAAYDQRTVGEFDVGAWHELLRDTDQGDARTAVLDHYRVHRERVMPADVLHRIAAQRLSRLDAAGDPLPWPDPDDPAYFEQLRAARAAVASGRPAAITDGPAG